MNETRFLVTRSAFTKAILSGHIVNIIIGLIVFTGLHYGLDQSTVTSILLTILSTTLGAILSSFIATKKLSAPVHALSKELVALHEKVNASTNELSRLNSDTQAMLEELPAGIITFDADDNLTHINEAAKRQLNLIAPANDDESQEITSTEVLEKIKEFQSKGIKIDFTDWLHESKTNKIQDCKLWPLSVPGTLEKSTAYDVIARYNKSDSHECEVVVLLIDRTEDFLKQEKQMEFISLAAHELRGPITLMRGIVDVFKNEVKDQLSAEHQELLVRMGVSARQLSGYVDNILNVSRIEKETFEVHLQEVDWQNIMQQSIEDLSIRATAHHRKLRFEVAKNLPSVAADPVAVTHVINNLVDNAIKYSKENGEIVVKYEVKDGQVETTIQDFGIGIPANVVDNLFTKFYRSHKSKQIATGTGLGLYLCKTIVEAHGGNIWVRSREGSGTTFGFSLPTYSSVAKSLKNGDNHVSGIVRGNHGWIKNHALYRR